MRWLVFFTIASVLVFFAFGSRISLKESVPEPVLGFFSWAETVNSFRAESQVLDTQQRSVATTTFYWENPGRWEMIMAEGDIVITQWRYVDDTLYVRDFEDGNFWMDSSSRPIITSSVDFRSWVKEAKSKETSKRFVWLRSEPCGETVCWVYVVRDSRYETGRETVRHRLWVMQDTHTLFREDYTGDTGMTITEYSEFNQVSIEKPELAKSLPEVESAYLATGSVVASEAAHLKVPFPFVAYSR